MKNSNCLAFVLTIAKYRRKGDYMLIRKSKHGWFPHFAAIIDSADGIIKIEFVPINPERKWIPPLFFKGEIVLTRYKEINKECYDEIPRGSAIR